MRVSIFLIKSWKMVVSIFLTIYRKADGVNIPHKILKNNDVNISYHLHEISPTKSEILKISFAKSKDTV